MLFTLQDRCNGTTSPLSCYGGRGMPTPNHDRLASESVRFDHCYSASPVCAPDRGCVFTGVNTPANGFNLFDLDEFHDLKSAPYEMTNRIDDPATAAERDRFHDWLLLEMAQTVDPMRCRGFRDRPWRKIKE